jgi:DNA-cytosine methyltransferase
MTKVNWNEYEGAADLVVGGPPCQAFSVAGLRKGLEDPRGNLTLEYLKAIDQISPEFVVFENVPGILSDKSHAFESFILGLNELGYLTDMDILDAQFFGVAQRRRRVFVVGWKVETLLKKKSASSKIITAQCLMEILQLTLEGLYQQSGTLPRDSESLGSSRDGVRKRMKLFGMRKADDALMLLESLEEDQERSLTVQNALDSILGSLSRDTLRAATIKQSAMDTVTSKSFTDSLWSVIWEENCERKKSSTTSTWTSRTIESKISICSIAVLLMLKLIEPLMSLETRLLYSLVESASTLIKEFMNHARTANEEIDLFSEFDASLDDLRGETLKRSESFARARAVFECRPQVLFERESLCWDSASSREKRKALTSGTQGSVGNTSTYQIAGNVIGRQPQNGGNGRGYANPDNDGAYTLTAADRFAVWCAADAGSNSTVGLDIAPTLTAHEANSASYIATPKTLQMRSGKEGGGKGALVADNLSATLTTGVQQTLFPGDGRVRRLTPVECERLQGFEDDWTDVPYRGKEHSPDSARYKALGNSMAVPVMKWIGEGIDLVDKEMDSLN